MKAVDVTRTARVRKKGSHDDDVPFTSAIPVAFKPLLLDAGLTLEGHSIDVCLPPGPFADTFRSSGRLSARWRIWPSVIEVVLKFCT